MIRSYGWWVRPILLLSAVIVVLAGCAGPKQQATLPEQEEPAAQEQVEEKVQEAVKEPVTPKEEVEETAGPLRIVKVRSFPENGYVLVGGSAAFNVTVEATQEINPEAKVELRLDGEPVAAKTITLKAGERKTIHFQMELNDLGTHIVEILNWRKAFSVIEPTIDPNVRPGEVPEDAKVVSEREGLTEPGIPGGQLVDSSFEPPKTFNPYSAQETSSTVVIFRMTAGLLEQNPMTYEIDPALAKSWEVSEDGLEFTFHLRRGVKFSDGHPFTADDVIFTINDIILNCDVQNNYRDSYFVEGKPIKFVKLDDYTVKAILPGVYRPFLSEIAGDPILPKHMLQSRVAKLVPGAWQHYSLSHCAFLDHEKELKAALREALKSEEPGLSGKELDEKVKAQLEGIKEAFKALSEAINSQDATEAKEAALQVSLALKELKGKLPDAAEDLKAVLEKAVSDLAGIEERAEAGEWGVRPGTFNDTWTTATDPKEFVGLGPFVITRYDVEQRVVLERNPYYWKVDTNGVQLPYLERYVFLIVKDRETEFAKFRTGEIDVYGARPQDWPAIKRDAEAKGWEPILGPPVFGTTWVVLNQDLGERGYPGDLEKLALQTVFRELKFRKAFAYAINKQSMIDNIYLGLGSPQWSPVSYLSPFYDRSRGDDYDPYAYNPEKAKQLLDEIKLIDVDGDGVREITDAFLKARGFTGEQLAQLPPEPERDLELILSTNQGNEVREQLSEFIVSDLKEVGVIVNYKPKDFNALVTDLLGSKYEAVLLGLTGDVEPHAPNVWKTDGWLHFWRYSAAEDPPEWEKRLDELVDLGVATYDFEEAKKVYVELQHLVSDNLPLIYLINQRFLYVSKKSLGNNKIFRPNYGAPQLSYLLWWRDEARRTEVFE